jgi:hypothetical protein
MIVSPKCYLRRVIDDSGGYFTHYYSVMEMYSLFNDLRSLNKVGCKYRSIYIILVFAMIETL